MDEPGAGDDHRGFFDDGSPYLTHPLLTDERTADEIARIEDLIGPLHGPVLDLGCGFGRHSIELASQGIEVTGVDPSQTMIAEARKRAEQRSVSPTFVTQPAHGFDGQGRFSQAICLFTSFGQRDPFASAPATASTHGLLGAAATSLSDGAPLVIEVPDLERSRSLLAADEQLGPTQVTRTIDVDGLVTEVFDGPTGTFHLGYQAFTPDQISHILHENGFTVEILIDSGLVQPPGHLLTVIARNGA